MVKRILYSLFFISTILSSCKKDGTTTVAERPVVISYLLIGHPVKVNVYEQKAFSDTAAYGPRIGGLALALSDGTQTVQLTETTTGNYTYVDSTFLQTGKTYTLQFTYKNTVITASSLMPAFTSGYAASRTKFAIRVGVTPAESDSTAVRFSWNNPDSLYHVLVFKYDEANTYANGSGNFPSNFTVNAKMADYYDVPYRPFRYAGGYSAILYTVNKEYSDILTTNTNTNSQQLNNPPGNITNGYGIFAAMQADTIRMSLTN
ncbi:DUF4249 family protein [Mucilaginibacter sp. ZT4R22]|uniref:DUF4249 family protein n=1 Tax=Mucilaginibacter pankratovii TaxID=2772110 RepID=A0ABR7WRQ9_9SPHI|nr:DUF4249 family protein [Mucilaginibacter pankratovii]MBD1364911.1 DUF4249 family protein [Mucilaginibacter pankratovii]